MAADMPMKTITVRIMNEGHPGASEVFHGIDVTSRVNDDGTLIVQGIEWDDTRTGYRLYAQGCWHSVMLDKLRPSLPKAPPSPDPEAIGAADPTPGVVQALSGAQGLVQAGENEDG